MYYTTDIQSIFLFLTVDFCSTSESSFWVKIPILQDSQLLDKYHYIVLCSDCNSKHFRKILIGKILQRLYIVSANVEKCCSDPPSTPFRFKTLFPKLLGVLTIDSSGLMIPQLKIAPCTRAKPSFSGRFPQPITGQCQSIKSWMDLLNDYPSSRGETTEVCVVAASLPKCSFCSDLSFSLSHRCWSKRLFSKNSRNLHLRIYFRKLICDSYLPFVMKSSDNLFIRPSVSKYMFDNYTSDAYWVRKTLTLPS